jgi:hypothetical protein
MSSNVDQWRVSPDRPIYDRSCPDRAWQNTLNHMIGSALQHLASQRSSYEEEHTSAESDLGLCLVFAVDVRSSSLG